jgi:hypothetical protein
LDTTRSDAAAEADLERFIERRHDERVKREGERAEEELWQVSVRVHAERDRQEARGAWCEYHRHMQRLHERLATEHEEQAEKLLMEENQQEGAKQ